ncbi:SMC-Scp complex subunit ScpB [Candidatus Parcubacteria bacterium]|nr:SMC-Scp complex subunit ScpB [Candidatus Parcubacteria bacterium]
MNLSSQIEAILYFKGEPVSAKKLAEFLGVSLEEVTQAITELKKNLEGRGITIIEKESEYMLATAPGASDIIQKITKDELTRDIGKAGLETLSIVLYKGNVSRREIDYIRGVNSTFILRNLMIRGLVERVVSDTDQRQFLYKPTFELMSFIGIEKIEDLPEYSDMNKEMEAFESERKTDGTRTE